MLSVSSVFITFPQLPSFVFVVVLLLTLFALAWLSPKENICSFIELLLLWGCYHSVDTVQFICFSPDAHPKPPVALESVFLRRRRNLSNNPKLILPQLDRSDKGSNQRQSRCLLAPQGLDGSFAFHILTDIHASGILSMLEHSGKQHKPVWLVFIGGGGQIASNTLLIKIFLWPLEVCLPLFISRVKLLESLSIKHLGMFLFKVPLLVSGC